VAVAIKTVWTIVRMIVILPIDNMCYRMRRSAGLVRLPWALDALDGSSRGGW
jgi:hypothetical protein